MQKIRLDIEDLSVESFAVSAETAEARGTVRGQEDAALALRPTYPMCPSHHQTECCTADPLLC